MKTFILSTLTQLIFAIASFTLLFALSSNATDYQIRFFATAMIGCIIPIAVFNLIGLGIIRLSIRNVKSHNLRRIVFGVSIGFSLIVSLLMIMMDSRPTKNFFGIEISSIQYFGIQAIFWMVMGLILSLYFIRNNVLELREDENNFPQQNV